MMMLFFTLPLFSIVSNRTMSKETKKRILEKLIEHLHVLEDVIVVDFVYEFQHKEFADTFTEALTLTREVLDYNVKIYVTNGEWGLYAKVYKNVQGTGSHLRTCPHVFKYIDNIKTHETLYKEIKDLLYP